ncbi:MAG: PTS sugar transporter subunit IIB [Roseburia sp.]
MAVSFIRVDDRMIHGQTCTRWALEYPCDGLIAVNNAAAKKSGIKSSIQERKRKKDFCMVSG